jgi:hypothetical protein
MQWLILLIVTGAVTQNGADTQAPPQPQYIPFTSSTNCAAAKAALEAKSIGAFHVFGVCADQ